MTALEEKIAHRLNNSIDKIKPDDLNTILSAKGVKATDKKRIPYFKLGIAALSLCVVIIAGIVIKNNVINANTSGGKPFITGLTGYKQKITLPHCELFFNDGNIPLSRGLNENLEYSTLNSESDVAKRFGFDPIKDLWLPSGLKSTFGIESDTKNELYYCYDIYNVYDNGDKTFDSLHISYMADLHDKNSKTIGINLSYNAILGSSIDPKGEITVSNIYGTKVSITHQLKGTNLIYPNEMFIADFTYKGVVYLVYSNNGVTQEEFINVLLSIIKP